MIRFASRPVSRRASFDSTPMPGGGEPLRPVRTGARLPDVVEGAVTRPEPMTRTASREPPASGASTPTRRSHDRGLLSLLHPRQHTSDGVSHSPSHVSIRDALYDALKPRAQLDRVGLYESQRYAMLEHTISTDDEQHVSELVALLHAASTELIDAQTAALDHVISLCQVIASSSVVHLLRGPTEVERARRRRANEEVINSLRRAREAYRDRERLRVVEPFVGLFESDKAGTGVELSKVSHRGLCVGQNRYGADRTATGASRTPTRCSSPARRPSSSSSASPSSTMSVRASDCGGRGSRAGASSATIPPSTAGTTRIRTSCLASAASHRP